MPHNWMLDTGELGHAAMAVEPSGRSPVEGLLHKLAQLRHSHDVKKESPKDGSNSRSSASSDRRNANATASTSGCIPTGKAGYEILEMVGRGSTSKARCIPPCFDKLNPHHPP